MFKRPLLLLTLFTFLALSITSCFGPFNLTRRLHRWNQDVGTKWVQEGIFLAFIILPVYSVASLADAIIFNSIEFWGGKNPIQPVASSKVISDGKTRVLLAYSQGGLGMQVIREGQLLRSVRLEAQPDGGMIAYGRDGRPMMVARTLSDGSVRIEDKNGSPIAQYSAEEAQTILIR